MITAPTEHIINIDGQDLRVAVRSGQAGATPLLIISGIGASLELMQPFVDALEPDKSGDVIRFDVPGVGCSPLPSRPYRFSGLCRLIAKMLSELGYGQVDVLGISWGGGVAQQFALSQRSRCRRLVLVSTATGATMVPPKFRCCGRWPDGSVTWTAGILPASPPTCTADQREPSPSG